MLTLYLIFLLVGGTLIGVSLIFGGDSDTDAHLDVDVDGDLDFHADADVDADVDVHADADVDADASLGLGAAWMPFASVRFWLFFITFFGLTGTLLTTIGGLSSTVVIALIAALTGYVCGVGASATVKWLMRNEVDSAIRPGDLTGVRGQVLLPVREGGVGKVRLAIKGQIIDVRATTEDGVEYPIGADVMVYDSRPDGELLVTRVDEA